MPKLAILIIKKNRISSKTSAFIALVISTMMPLLLQAAHPNASVDESTEINCNSEQPSITFKPNTIFDESEDGIIFLHRWANAVHIDTKVITLENEATFFINRCNKTRDDMDELERHLRNRKYLRDAKVTEDKENNNITVTTWDNWSLMPTISLGRKGGVNTYSFGIKERNLLGLGIDTEISTYKNTQRSGYKLSSSIPLFQKQNTNLSFKFSDNDDGQQYNMFVHKIFASFHSKNSYLIGFNEEEREDTIFQNDQTQNIYARDITRKEANYAWLHLNTNSRVLRYQVGISQNKDDFTALPTEEKDKLSAPLLTDEIPENRDLLYPWFAFEYIEKDFRKLMNIHLISQIEDFNQGWQINSKLGIGNGTKENSAWTIWQMRVKKGFNIHDSALLLLDFSLANDIYRDRSDRLLAKVSGEYFYRLTPQWGFYFNSENTFSQNQYQDQPITLGGSTGIRGFPLQYQHGESSVKVSSEIRYYPNINLFKLFDLAGVAFADKGRTYGEPLVENIENGWLASVGLGLRLFSPHSAGNHHVIHIDFAFPQSTNEDVDSFEIRVQAKKSF